MEGEQGNCRSHVDILPRQQVSVLPGAVLRKASLSPLPSVAPACLFGKNPFYGVLQRLYDKHMEEDAPFGGCTVLSVLFLLL